jgi:hypothetical protein
LATAEWYVLAIALFISGFIGYKTIQWALYEEIGTGKAALFLFFAVIVFFSINHYDLLMKWRASKDLTETSARGVALMNAELQKQMETTKLLAESVRKAGETANDLALEANRKGQSALEALAKTEDRLEKVSSVQASATWEILMSEFMDVERYLRRWEEENSLRREVLPADSLTDLAKKLKRLGKVMPETVQMLYFERQRKYEILKELKEKLDLFSTKYKPNHFDLPPAPKLPAKNISNAESGRSNALQ